MEKKIGPIKVSSAREKVGTAILTLAKEPHVEALYEDLKKAGVGDELLKLCWLVATKGSSGVMVRPPTAPCPGAPDPPRPTNRARPRRSSTR